jgi:hypothetical protein
MPKRNSLNNNHIPRSDKVKGVKKLMKTLKLLKECKFHILSKITAFFTAQFWGHQMVSRTEVNGKLSCNK